MYDVYMQSKLANMSEQRKRLRRQERVREKNVACCLTYIFVAYICINTLAAAWWSPMEKEMRMRVTALRPLAKRVKSRVKVFIQNSRLQEWCFIRQIPPPPPNDPSLHIYVKNMYADKGPLVKAHRPHIEFRGKQFRTHIIPKDAHFYRGFQNQENKPQMLSAFPQYFSSYNIAGNYSVLSSKNLNAGGGYLRAVPVRDLNMFDLSHAPSILNFLELLDEDKSKTEKGTDHHEMLEKWMCIITFATGVSIPNKNDKDNFSMDKYQYIYPDDGYTKKDAQFEKLSKRLHMGVSVRRNKFWEPKYNVNIKEYGSDRIYSFGSFQDALLRASYTHIDYMLVEALKQTFPNLDGYAAGYTPVRSVNSGAAFPPEMCVFYPSVLMRYTFSEPFAMAEGGGRQKKVESSSSHKLFTGGYDDSIAQRQQLLTRNASDDKAEIYEVMIEKLEVTLEQYLSFMKQMYCAPLIDDDNNNILDDDDNNNILGGGSKNSKTSPKRKSTTTVTTREKNQKSSSSPGKRKDKRQGTRSQKPKNTRDEK